MCPMLMQTPHDELELVDHTTPGGGCAPGQWNTHTRAQRMQCAASGLVTSVDGARSLREAPGLALRRDTWHAHVGHASRSHRNHDAAQAAPPPPSLAPHALPQPPTRLETLASWLLDAAHRRLGALRAAEGSNRGGAAHTASCSASSCCSRSSCSACWPPPAAAAAAARAGRPAAPPGGAAGVSEPRPPPCAGPRPWRPAPRGWGHAAGASVPWAAAAGQRGRARGRGRHRHTPRHHRRPRRCRPRAARARPRSPPGTHCWHLTPEAARLLAGSSGRPGHRVWTARAHGFGQPATTEYHLWLWLCIAFGIMVNANRSSADV